MIVVTGATGHLGQWTVSRLLALGHDVVGLARRSASTPSIDVVAWKRPVRAVDCDLRSLESIEAAAAVLLEADAVVHLAEHVPVDTARDDALLERMASISASLQLLEVLSRSTRLRSFVYGSSFEVYGPPLSLPIAETHPTRPDTFYGAGKLTVEHYVRLFASSGAVAWSAFRMPAIYGPGDRHLRAIGNFVRAAAEGRPLRIAGDGEDRRDLVFASDAAEALAAAVERRARGIFNLGSGRGYRVREIAEVVSRLAEDGPSIVQEPRAKPRRDYGLNIDRARRLLGWEPRTSLEEGTRAQLDWYRRSRAKPPS